MVEPSWREIGLYGRILLAAVTLHGITSRGWRDAHTIGVLLCAVAVVGSEMSRA